MFNYVYDMLGNTKWYRFKTSLIVAISIVLSLLHITEAECVDGRWNAWESWGHCNVSCGNGTRSRYRTCHPPTNGGSDCKGANVKNESCHPADCPIDGRWNAWESWGHCNVSCGNGMKSRYRTCHPPTNGGSDCKGTNVKIESCHLAHCPRSGDWLSWGEWSRCTKTCASGLRHRTRVCNMTSHGELTKECDGSAKEPETCNKFTCEPAKSCTELRKRGLEEDAVVSIDPDGGGPNAPIDTHCNMTAENKEGVTSLWHNFMNYTLVENFQGSHRFFRSLQYVGSLTADHPQLVKLIDISTACKQFISFKCKGSTFSSGDVFHTYWENRGDTPRSYWGGGSVTKPYGCDCGLENSCAQSDVTCNCNIGDDVWREDSGYITNMEDLPVRKFVVGDTGGEKKGSIAVGPLLCWGSKD